jgi:DNA-binding response OmpR family regulator
VVRKLFRYNWFFRNFIYVKSLTLENILHKNVLSVQKVMIADDNKSLLDILQSLLRMEGYEVQVSLNAKDICKMVCLNTPDLILLDIEMDGINGCEICKELKKGNSTSGIAIIMVSGNANLELQARSCGADAYLPKPFGMSELVTVVNDMLAAKQAS